MADTPLRTIKQLLESSIERTDDSEVRFKLRTASQLVDVVEHQHDDLVESLGHTEFEDDELREKLRDLGIWSDRPNCDTDYRGQLPVIVDSVSGDDR